MKKILFTIGLVGIFATATAQEIRVEKSIFEIQLGILNANFRYEGKLTNETTLGVELGMAHAILRTNATPFDASSFVYPSITVAPRWYYNLNKRASKSKNTEGNSANFLSLISTYNSSLLNISEKKGIKLVDNISVKPIWGGTPFYQQTFYL